MIRWCSLKTALLMFIFAAVWLPGSLTAKEGLEAGSDNWIFSAQPYAWLPTLEADMKFSTPNGSSGSPSVSVEPDDYLENLELAAILGVEARKGKWSFTADLVYMKLSSSGSTVKSIDFGGSHVSTNLDIGSEVEMKSFISTFGMGYQAINTTGFKMDVIAGLRYLWIEPTLEWSLSGAISGPGGGQTFSQSGSHTEDGNVWNGIGGVRGKITIGNSNWFIPFYADIGAGDSDFTWQVFSALGYSFNNKIDAMMGWRHLQFEEDGNPLMQELRLSGPIIGLHYNF